MELQEARQKIDSIDSQLVALFQQRMQLSADIADFKKKHGLQIYVPAREQEVLDHVTAAVEPALADYVRILYSTIFKLSRSYQEGSENS